MLSITSLNEYLQVVTHIVTILGLPLALGLFYHEKVKERREREYGTYNALDDKYIHFLELCLEKPELEVFDPPSDPTKAYPSDEKARQTQILYLILISILEGSFLMYSDQSNSIKKRQWNGWVEYMKDYCNREGFRSAWPELGPQFDARFVSFMETLMDATVESS